MPIELEMVLRLLRRIQPIALVTTHFLDFAVQLQVRGSEDGLAFLQAEVDEGTGPTFRFIPGVAATSLAVGTAKRLGVTFEELEEILTRRVGFDDTSGSQQIHELADGDRDE